MQQGWDEVPWSIEGSAGREWQWLGTQKCVLLSVSSEQAGTTVGRLVGRRRAQLAMLTRLPFRAGRQAAAAAATGQQPPPGGT